jgi:hypothetical protein
MDVCRLQAKIKKIKNKIKKNEKNKNELKVTYSAYAILDNF